MSAKQKKKNGLLHDVYTSVGSTFTALFCDSTEEIAEEAVKQHIKRENDNNKNKQSHGNG